jgi:hypothetical protein
VDLTTRVRAAGLDKKIVPQRMRLFEHGGRVYGLPQSAGSRRRPPCPTLGFHCSSCLSRRC